MKDKQNMPLEIEKKFLIKMPDLKWIEKNTDVIIAEISQTYLGIIKDGFGERVRRFVVDDKVKYYHTAKKSLSDMTRIEIEKEITKEEYQEYMSRNNRRATMNKTRYIIKMNGMKYEIDVYPFWEETAILEIELEDEKQKYEIPEFIEVIGDVTGNRDYSNSSLVFKFQKKNQRGNPRRAPRRNKKRISRGNNRINERNGLRKNTKKRRGK